MKKINESVLYPEKLKERMNKKIEDDLINQKHSLGKHPAFPDSDEYSFEEKIIGERFYDVCKRYKRVFEVDTIDGNQIKFELPTLLFETVALESTHRKELVDLAIKMVREEFDMDEDAVEINAELTDKITMDMPKMNKKPMPVKDMEFDSHNDIKSANDEVYKRRFVNAMIQGAAKKCNHMFHMVDDELADIEPRLANRYSKIMSMGDYMYFYTHSLAGNDDGTNAFVGGVVNVEYPNDENTKSVINAQALVFPVLIHELIKGVMELISGNGLPTDKKLANFVIQKADFVEAEVWDMRIGPALWTKFTSMIPVDDFNLKHHVYAELISLSPNDFNNQMKEILAGTNTGKKIIKDIIDGVKADIAMDEFDSVIDMYVDDDEDDEEEFL